ncbi:MAG TPA: DUF2235 domain-containing protein [Nocardioidaceae bacterium]|nr:DUF2235 domain-containing protein [Nocardioidaceae bacterium]
MGKNVVVCLDGTGNQVKAKGSTNVVRLFEMLDLSDETKQVAYYDPGVGTFSSQGAWTPAGKAITKGLGLAVGRGMRENLGEAYTFLMQHWEPGDRLFVFGFSRGAYTARALTGLIHRAGVLRPGCENLVPYAVASYARSKQEWTEDDWDQIDRLSAAFARSHEGSRSVPVEFLGLWDSVKAAGILRWNLRWPYTRQLPNARNVWHAVSIDEKRRPYREYLVQAKPPKSQVNEVWFAGVHSDVGGTFEDDPRLAEISLKWMVDGARDAGLLVKPKAYAKAATLTEDHAHGVVHDMGWVWAFLTYRRRPVPPAARVHASVRHRLETDGQHRDRIPTDATWEDDQWLTPRT